VKQTSPGLIRAIVSFPLCGVGCGQFQGGIANHIGSQSINLVRSCQRPLKQGLMAVPVSHCVWSVGSVFSAPENIFLYSASDLRFPST